MKNLFSIFTVASAIALLPTVVSAADSTADLKTQKDKVSYGVGMNIGTSLKRSGFEVDVDLLSAAIKDVMADKKTRLTEQEAREVITAYQQEVRAKKEQERLQIAEKNRKAGEEFLAANKTKEGVKTHSVTLPDGKTAEIQYKVVTEGTGATPGSNDTVTVNYRGTFIDGKEFDSSAKNGSPAKFSVRGVIPGWTAALQMMKVGAKWQVFIPSALAYGDMGRPNIDPGSTLVFEVELLSAETPPPPQAPAPLTSDIIRVPSADELKKGAKVEVLKPEDVERQIKAAAATNKPSSTVK
jgi:FKBP-type peptidyl-prolyl cis-trans isomerase FklB